jgi:hypothetical protein
LTQAAAFIVVAIYTGIAPLAAYQRSRSPVRRRVEADTRVWTLGPQGGPDHDAGLVDFDQPWWLFVLQQQQPRPGGVPVRLRQRFENLGRRRRLIPSTTACLYHRRSSAS